MNMIKKKNERGQSLVELSISLVLLLLLVVGLVEFGMAFFQFVQLRDAAQEGALYGSMNPTDTAGITARVIGASNSPIDLTTATINISYSDTTKMCEGQGITVRVSYRHRIFMPLLAQILGKTLDPYLPLNATVTDTILTPVCP